MSSSNLDNVDPLKEKKAKIFAVNILQFRDEMEERLEKCYNIVLNLVGGLSERENHNLLNQVVSKGVKEHEEVSLGLFYIIMTDPQSASKAYRDLSFVSKDSCGLIISKIHQILAEKFQKLLDLPRAQLLWLLGEMMKTQVLNLEPVILVLLRQIAGGDHSAGNIWLIDNVLKLLKSNRPWLDKNPNAVQFVIYTYLRIIEDHENPKLKSLRQLEVDFCVQLIREKFSECLVIGRDFVRLLQSVFRIPEFTKLWKDILHRPQSLNAQFTGLPQLLNVRTSRKFLASRVTPDMDNKLHFLAMKVRFGLQKRYQEWFFRQYLSNPESQTLLPDLVRFICGVIHPSNEILGSEVIPRWAIVGWLYTTCQNPVTQSNMKLALFYDWLFYQDRDNIMNIEPAILLMHNSLRTHPNITYGLLDFICRMSTNYCPQFVNLTKQGLFNSFKNILDKRVVSSLSPILKSSRMDKELKQLVAETLPLFVGADKITASSSDEPSSPKSNSPPQSPTIDSAKDFSLNLNEPSTSGSVEVHDESSTDEAVFSDEDEEEKAVPPPPPPPPVSEKKVIPPLPASSTSFRPITIKEEDFETKVDEGFVGDDITELEEFQNLDSNLLKDNVIKLKNERDESAKAEAMEAVISNIESMGDFDDEIAAPLCVCLANCLAEDLALPTLPDPMVEQTIEKAIESTLERPQYVICRSICALSKNDINRENLYVLLNGIHEIDPKIGYHFLFFLKAWYNDEEKFSVYEDYVTYFKDRTLKTFLTQDLKACQEYDPKLFMYLIEMIFKYFKDVAVGNKEIIRLLAATIHPDEMNTILTNVMLGELSIVGENQVGGLLEASLDWSSFEQACLWQIIHAEETPIEMLVGILPVLKLPKHSEALNHLLLQIRSESPQMEIIKTVLCMDVEGAGKNFCLCLFKSWSHEEARELAHILAQLLSKPSHTNKRKHGNSARHNPTLGQIALHLNFYYKHCQDTNNMALFKYESLRYALTQAKKNITDPDIKTKCKPLFAEFSELPARATRKRKNLRVMRGGRAAATRKDESSDDSGGSGEEQESDEESGDEDDDEEEIKPNQRPPTKKRRKSSKNVSSDEED